MFIIYDKLISQWIFNFWKEKKVQKFIEILLERWNVLSFGNEYGVELKNIKMVIININAYLNNFSYFKGDFVEWILIERKLKYIKTLSASYKGSLLSLGNVRSEFGADQKGING